MGSDDIFRDQILPLILGKEPELKDVVLSVFRFVESHTGSRETFQWLDTLQLVKAGTKTSAHYIDIVRDSNRKIKFVVYITADFDKYLWDNLLSRVEVQKTSMKAWKYYLYNPEKKLIMPDIIQDKKSKAKKVPELWFKKIKEKYEEKFTGYLDDKFDKDYLISIRHEPTVDKLIFSTYPKKNVTEELKNRKIVLLRNLSCITIAIFLLALIFILKLLKSINQIKMAMQAVENQEYDYKLELSTRDEIEDLATTFNTMLQGLAEKEKLALSKAELKFAFSRFLSPDIVNAIEDDPSQLALGGKTSFITAFFTDIEGFSSFSEVLSPQKLVELLNDYLTEMTDILLDASGTLDKFEGDAIIAFFGAPLDNPDNPKDAMIVALYMQKRLQQLREKWSAEGEKWPKKVRNMRMRIGINSGDILTGNMGSKNRMNYTMMGDPVNLAARLESAAKQYGIYIMVSEASLKNYLQMFTAREVDLLRVVGRKEACRVYELLDFIENYEQWEKLLSLYNAGLAEFRQKNFRKARDYFEWSLKVEKNTKISPSKVWLDRCEEILADPEKEPHGQVYSLSEK
ncbi:adenylate/guanylate cyclase domain-containing protein [Candidatus Riflebacteria bacterium]